MAVCLFVFAFLPSPPFFDKLFGYFFSGLCREFAASLKKPFTVRYNPYTESIEVLDNNTRLRDLAVSINSDMQVLVHALDSRS